jgi:hypothetical protein
VLDGHFAGVEAKMRDQAGHTSRRFEMSILAIQYQSHAASL